MATSELRIKRAGYALHVMTASGAVAGLLALQAVIDNNIRGALIWLVVCQVLDGLDGPIARKIDVVIHAPRVDGYVLDLIVDYLTCVVVPVALLVRLEILPHEFQQSIYYFKFIRMFHTHIIQFNNIRYAISKSFWIKEF